jgi:hypothetical protein
MGIVGRMFATPDRPPLALREVYFAARVEHRLAELAPPANVALILGRHGVYPVTNISRAGAAERTRALRRFISRYDLFLLVAIVRDVAAVAVIFVR